MNETRALIWRAGLTLGMVLCLSGQSAALGTYGKNDHTSIRLAAPFGVPGVDSEALGLGVLPFCGTSPRWYSVFERLYGSWAQSERSRIADRIDFDKRQWIQHRFRSYYISHMSDDPLG